jgi:hypothetical protein
MRATCIRRVTSASFNSPQLFCKFTEGSRRVTLKPRNAPGQGADARVHIIPMSHAATRPFFDSVIKFIHEEMASIGVADPHDVPEILRGTCKILMEGLAESDEERNIERQEIVYLVEQVKQARLGNKQAEDFLRQFTGKVESNSLYLEETQRAIAQSYQLPFPLPAGLWLQDGYFRPLCSARFGPQIAACDVCLDDFTAAERSKFEADPQVLRQERERRCAMEVRRMVAAGAKQVFVPWGHFHMPPIMGKLMSHHEGITMPGGDLVFDVADAAKDPTPYGWTDEMLDAAYGAPQAS